MQLTGKQIVEQGIIDNYCEKGVQQQGLDVRLTKVRKMKQKHLTAKAQHFDMVNDVMVNDAVYIVDWDKCGKIPRHSKTVLPEMTEWMQPEKITRDGEEIEVFRLTPGYYEIEFFESCKIPRDKVLNYKTRSSLVRCGVHVFSGQFDGGFETRNMGAYLLVLNPIEIEYMARVAQAVVTESYPVTDEYLYNGQWQNDKQRK